MNQSENILTNSKDVKSFTENFNEMILALRNDIYKLFIL